MDSPRFRWLLCLCLAANLSAACRSSDNDDPKSQTVKEQKDAIMVAIPNAKQPLENVISGGQPSEAQLKEAKDKGIKTVINLRSNKEKDAYAFEEESLKSLGLGYVHIPVQGLAGITQANMEALSKALDESPKPILLHCASGNRVGALFALKAVMKDKKSEAEAMEIGKAAGMTKLEEPVREIIQAHLKTAK